MKRINIRKVIATAMSGLPVIALSGWLIMKIGIRAYSIILIEVVILAIFMLGWHTLVKKVRGKG